MAQGHIQDPSAEGQEQLEPLDEIAHGLHRLADPGGDWRDNGEHWAAARAAVESFTGPAREDALRAATSALSRWSAEEPGVGQLAFMPCERGARAVLDAVRAGPHSLARYTHHLDRCARRESTANDCTCGLQEAWAQLSAGDQTEAKPESVDQDARHSYTEDREPGLHIEGLGGQEADG